MMIQMLRGSNVGKDMGPSRNVRPAEREPHQRLHSSRDHEAKIARRAEGLDSVTKSLCTSTSMGSTLLHSRQQLHLMRGFIQPFDIGKHAEILRALLEELYLVKADRQQRLVQRKVNI